MKTILLILMIVIGCHTASAQKDSVVCLTKAEIVILANKIRLLQDSLQFKGAIISAQDTLIVKSENRLLLYKQQLDNREQVVTAYKEQAAIMQKTIEDLRPKWYDNKFLWFSAGAATVIATVLLAR